MCNLSRYYNSWIENTDQVAEQDGTSAVSADASSHLASAGDQHVAAAAAAAASGQSTADTELSTTTHSGDHNDSDNEEEDDGDDDEDDIDVFRSFA